MKLYWIELEFHIELYVYAYSEEQVRDMLKDHTIVQIQEEIRKGYTADE